MAMQPVALCAVLLWAGATMRAEGVRVTGRVVDVQGRPVPRAKVDLARAGTFTCLAEAVADAAGRFVLTAPEGPVRFAARAPGLVPGATSLDVREGETPEAVSIVLRPGAASLLGRVTVPGGGAVPRGEVWLQDFNGISAEKTFRTPLEGGRFAFVLPPGAYRYRVCVPGFAVDEGFARITGERRVTVPLSAVPAGPGPAVKAWIRHQAIPLGVAGPAGLDPVIGDARLVGLGEATHGTHDFQAFKSALIQHLVAEKGFSFVVFEEDFVKAEGVNAYVLRGEGSPEAALAQLDVNWWDTREVLDLVRWLRAWNASHDRKVAFRGCDVHSALPHFDAVMADLAGLDPALAAQTAAGGLDRAFSAGAEASARPTKEALRKGMELTDGLLLELRARMGSWPADRASRMLMRARLLRQYFWKYAAADPYMARDKVMADTALELLEPAGSRGILWAHNGHVGMEDIFGFPSQGGYLRRALGQGYRPVGLTFNRGGFRAWAHPDEGFLGELNFELGPAGPESLEGALAAACLPILALDLRKVPRAGAVGDWFRAGHPLRGIGGGFCPGDPDYMLHLTRTCPAGAFDALVGFDRTSPIQPNPSKWSVIDLPLGQPLAAPANLDFAAGSIGQAGFGWVFTSFASDDAPLGLHAARPAPASLRVEPGGRRSLALAPFPQDPTQTGVVAQAVDASRYRGREVRFSVRVLAEGPGHDARIWVRAARPGGHPAALAVRRRVVEPGSGWVSLVVKARIPRDATELAFGVSSLGPAALLVREASLH